MSNLLTHKNCFWKNMRIYFPMNSENTIVRKYAIMAPIISSQWNKLTLKESSKDSKQHLLFYVLLFELFQLCIHICENNKVSNAQKKKYKVSNALRINYSKIKFFLSFVISIIQKAEYFFFLPQLLII